MQHSTTWSIAFTSALLVELAIGVAGCGGSCGGVLASGRVIQASSDTISTSASFEADTSHLQLGSVTVDVEPTRVVIEGDSVVELSAQAKRVEVTRLDGQLKIVADGKTVYEAPLRK